MLRVIAPRIPGPLVVLVLGIAASTAFDLQAYGVTVVGALPTGLPGVSLPSIGLADLPFLAAGAAGIVFLAVGESLGAARAFATRHGYEIDPDQELVALGAANISSGLFGGFTTDASLSQSATAEAAGTRSQLVVAADGRARTGDGASSSHHCSRTCRTRSLRRSSSPASWA